MSVAPTGRALPSRSEAPAPQRRGEEAASAMRAAAQANLQTPGRKGHVVELAAPEVEEVFISADLHGHWQNYWAILEQADLDRHPKRHLILQEVCHGGPDYKPGVCGSHAMLEAIAELKLRYPDRVHYLLSNHELAELTGHPIRKDGRMLLISFMMGVHHCYGPQAELVHNSYGEFIGSCPAAVRIGKNVVVTHSVPEGVPERGFDASVFEREWDMADLKPNGAVFDLVWGRDYRPENAEAFAQLVNARFLVHGHTPCPAGHNTPNDWQLILDCSSTPATCLLAPTTGVETMDDLLKGLRPLWTTAAPSARESADEASGSDSSYAFDSASTDVPPAKSESFNLASINESLKEAMQIEGALAAALVDSSSGTCLGAIGNHVDLNVAAAGNSEVVRAKLKVMESLDLDDNIEDILISLSKEYHIIRLLEQHKGLFLYLLLRRSTANLALARRKLQDIEKTMKV